VVALAAFRERTAQQILAAVVAVLVAVLLVLVVAVLSSFVG